MKNNFGGAPRLLGTMEWHKKDRRAAGHFQGETKKRIAGGIAGEERVL